MAFVQFQRCVSTEPYFEQWIPSQSGKNLSYQVYSVWPDDPASEYTCICPAFLFKGACKHQMMAWSDRCHWTGEDPEAEKQTDDQKENETCPRCGNETVKDVMKNE